MKKFLLALSLVTMLLAIISANARAEVLYIGDSHSAGGFGHVLDKKLRELPGAKVRTRARCGSSQDWWFKGTTTPCGYYDRDNDGKVVRHDHPIRAKTPLLPRLLEAPLAAGEKRVTIVALGSNDVGNGASKAVKASIERMVDAIRKSGSTCIWIGPPDMRMFGKKKIDAYYSILSDALASSDGPLCPVIDSRKYTSYPAKGGDGVHFSAFPAAARVWAEKVFSELEPLLTGARGSK